MKSADNLRGWQALIYINDTPRLVEVITHIRDSRWLVQGRDLPKRCERMNGSRRTTVSEDELILVPPK